MAILVPKAAATPLAAFVVTVILLVAADPLAFEHGGQRSEHQSPEAARRAEELFQDALLLSDTGQREAARLRLQEAMRLWASLREHEKAAKAAMQMGDHYKQVRKYQNAIDHYKLALKVESCPGLVKTSALNALALIYAELYQTDLAIHYFMKALNQARVLNDRPAQMLALTGLAHAHYQQGDRAQALNFIARAQQLNQQTNAEPDLLYLLGQVRQEEGLMDKAKAAFEQALEIFGRDLNEEGQIRVLCSMSTLYLLSSKKQEALQQAEQAVDLAEKRARLAANHEDKVSARALRWRAWLSRARAERALGQKEQAIKSYFWAINHFEGTWWAAYNATETSAIASREEIQAGYREYINLLVENGRFNEAYGLADAAKARTILNFVQARRSKPSSGDANQASTLRELSLSIARLRLQLLASNISPAQQAKLQKEIEDAEYEMRELQLQAEIDRSRDRVVWSQLATAEQLQKKMGEEQAALVEFTLGEEKSCAWLFARGEVFFETLPARNEIEKAVRRFLELLAATPNHIYIEREIAKEKEQAATLFSTLFGRLSSRIEPGQRLIVVPDGLLHYLPFEALIHDGRYLVEHHEISYISSASMLGLLQDSASKSDGSNKMELLAVGDPVFESNSTGTGGKESRSGQSNKTRQIFAARGFRLTPLPKTRDEIKYIASLFAPDRRKVLMGKEGTEEAIKREPLQVYRRLHIASHSLIDEKSPLQSGVALTPGDDAEEDGFLDVSEISKLNLDCDLVVVSACQTGRGQLLSGEGIVGLSRAFLYAGARSVVVSLWNVSDISTSQLMKDFYQNLTDGLRNVPALRRAKLQMLNSGKETRHPYYWSSFVLVGEP